MESIDQSRPSWKLCFLSWAWLVMISLAPLFANVLVDAYGWGNGFRFGWPFWFARGPRVPTHEPYFGIWQGWAHFTPFGELRLVGNFFVCLFVLSMSTLTVERWCRRQGISRFRFGLRGLLAFTAWVALCYVFFRPSDETKLLYLIVFRFRDWSLFVLYIGFGLSTVAVIDLVSTTIDAIFHRLHLRD